MDRMIAWCWGVDLMRNRRWLFELGMFPRQNCPEFEHVYRFYWSLSIDPQGGRRRRDPFVLSSMQLIPAWSDEPSVMRQVRYEQSHLTGPRAAL